MSGKKNICVYSTTPYITSPNGRGKQFASVAINVRSQVGSQALVLLHILRLSPTIRNGSHARGRRVGDELKSRGRVADGVNVVHCRSDAADASARCWSPGGSNNNTDTINAAAARCKCRAGSNAASWCPTALSFPTI